MSMFDRMDRITSRTVDRVHAIPFEFMPMTSTPNGRPEQDSTRPVINGMGIFDLEPVFDSIETGKRDRVGNDFTTLHMGSRYDLSIDRRWFPINMDEPRQGDLVAFPTKPELPDFQVISGQRDGLSRMVLKLVRT